ncbi:FecR family protein [Noviherbaspirillum sp. CPCC 100848]|uniref:FecR family protein n=1 Tax=Noviherbaspirillum album TaxID=3080276 RepID=A0ABU6JIJ7_9BURK|nr:FecR family protein [Noviherbaspirillum sp. CPCC 100848]MEC4723512.1 FecR family protein [Noviherbaspirillum sp. CPCC 100848]
MLRRIVSVITLLSAAGLAQAGEAARIVFVAGQVQSAGAQLTLGNPVQEGDEITTGADGYIYLKTIDNGFLILRPNSKAKIIAYHVDAAKPANTRIKLELTSGVARAISGDGARQAKENFRFNTPVAAIGVRGTDFTVYTDHETSRVAVISGGVVVSGFSSACGPEGAGPCEGGNSRELFAREAGQLLQVRKGQAAPQVLPSSGASPDLTAPPRSDEPSGKAAGTNASGTAGNLAAKEIALDPQKTSELVNLAASLKPVDNGAPSTTVPLPSAPLPPPVVITAPKEIIWGRWQALADQPATINTTQVRADGAQLSAINSYFALLRARGSDYQSPTSGAVSFSMRDGAGVIVDASRGNLATPATLENGRLSVDFAKSSFATSFDLVHQAERIGMQATGQVTQDGRMFGEGQFANQNNMNVEGILSNENGGSAAYLFDRRIDANRNAYGGTYWTK